MCFLCNKGDDEPAAPRPAQPRPSSIDKSAKVPNRASSSVGPGASGKQFNSAPSDEEAFPPPGPPPPGLMQQQHPPPPGPPPPGLMQQHPPPPGPPPSHEQQPPPPGPPPPTTTKEAPPSYDTSNPHQHDWEMAVPDTSLFPPPPAIFSGFERSPTSNATEEEAIAGEEWCQSYPLSGPMTLDDASKGALHFHNIRLMEPAGFNGKMDWLAPGRWRASTKRGSPDRCIISYPPLYSAMEHDPLRTGQPRSIYYEVRLLEDSPTVYVGLGFTALPYPSFRMPGWHRGSLAVHGDDGHRYINDRWGGKTFTDSFCKGDTYGIGMTLKPTDHGSDGKPLVDIFFTHNGALVGGWNIHEETDAVEDLPVTGLEGLHDLCAAVGTYDGVKVEVIFEPSAWLYKDLE